MLDLFLKGLIIGFAIAAPVGPIGILCIQRSLHEGFKIGLLTGLGAASADGVYGIVTGFGLTAISSILIAQQFWIRLVGGLFLLYLGIKLCLSHPPKRSSQHRSERSLFHAYITTFFLTLTNPTTILSFLAIFTSVGLGTLNTTYSQALCLITGIIFGSACWWLFLSGGVAFILHHRINTSWMQWINRFSGGIILLFGVFTLGALYEY